MLAGPACTRVRSPASPACPPPSKGGDGRDLGARSTHPPALHVAGPPRSINFHAGKPSRAESVVARIRPGQGVLHAAVSRQAMQTEHVNSEPLTSCTPPRRPRLPVPALPEPAGKCSPGEERKLCHAAAETGSKSGVRTPKSMPGIEVQAEDPAPSRRAGCWEL